MKFLHIGLSATGAPHNGLQKAMINNVSAYKEIHSSNPTLNAKAIDIALSWKPDFTFIQVQAQGIIYRKTVDELRKHGKVVNWTGDVRDPIPKWYYDMGCTTAFSSETDAKRFPGGKFLQIGFDPEIYKPKGEIVPTKPVVFSGNNYGSMFPLGQKRAEMVRFLSKRSDFQVYGGDWSPIPHRTTGQNEEAGIYRAAKIAINYSHFNYERYASDRLFRILGSGCFCLTHKYTGVEKDFEDGKHLVTFNDLNDLNQKIGYYLQNEKERQEIAAQGCELAHKNFTFDSMIKNLLKL